MPPKLTLKPQGSEKGRGAPNTPIVPNAPNQDAGSKYAEENVSGGNVSGRQKVKKYAETRKYSARVWEISTVERLWKKMLMGN